MALPFSTLATGVVSISLIHSLVPHHWFPFVVMGRKHGWKARKTLSVLALGALAHMVSTIAVGIAVGYLGQELDKRFEIFHGVVPGLILVGFGGGLFLSNFTHRHMVTEKMAAPTLIMMLALSPCVLVAPFFILLGPMGFWAVVEVCTVMSLLSIFGMVSCGWLAMHGLKAVKLNWLEEHESLVMGIVLMALGISSIFHT